MLEISFLTKKMRYRSQHATLRNELLARAVGCKPRDNPRIVDATAGLGRDSFILAALGFEITLLERSELLYTLLKHALEEAQSDPAIGPIVARMHLIHTDAVDWLQRCQQEQQPDVIYLDPMFPDRKKSASVKKEMAFLQELLVKETDQANLLQAAMHCAKKRVVVKRPRLAANIGERAANFAYKGKSCRFDIYLI